MNMSVSSGIVNTTLNNSVQKSELPDASWSMPGAAKFYALLGWPVFPVGPDKKSLIPAWQAAATTDLDQIETWWRRHPDAMIGMLCGPKSGVAVVDADAKPDAAGADGLEHLRKLENQHKSLDRLPTVLTPGGGIHLYMSANSLPFGKSVGRIGPKIDLQSARPDGDGSSYAIMPPSMNRDGRRYEWEQIGLEQLKQLGRAPHWLALRACFTSAEIEAIDSNPILSEVLELADRADWRSIFDADRDTVRKQRALDRNHAVQVNAKALTLDHPYVAVSVDNIFDGLRGVKEAQNPSLFVAAANLGGLLSGAGIAGPSDLGTPHADLSRITDRLFEAAMALPVLDPRRPWDDREGQRAAGKTIESGFKKGLQNPRDLSHLHKADRTSKQEQAPAQRFLSAVSVDQIKAKPIKWLWQDRIALGKLSMIAGDPGLGKSRLSCDIAARVTNGQPFHMTMGQGDPPANVIVISGEDDPEDTFRPRLEAAGADLKRVHLAADIVTKTADGSTKTDTFSFQKNIPELEALIERVGEVRLLIIDPLSAYLGTTDSHNNSEVRAILTPLAQLAARRNLAILIVAHLNKDSGQKKGSGGQKAIYRVSGSLGFVAAARSVFLVTKQEETDDDDTDPTERLFIPIKNNLAEEATGLVYRIETAYVPGPGTAVIGTSRILWLDKTTHTSANAAVNGDGGADDSRLVQAVDFLRATLSSGPKPVKEINAESEAAGLSRATVRRASGRLQVRVRKSKTKDGGWTWELPQQPNSRLNG